MCEFCRLLEQLKEFPTLNENEKNFKEILMVACQRHKRIVNSLNQIKEEINKLALNVIPNNSIVNDFREFYLEKLNSKLKSANSKQKKKINSVTVKLNSDIKVITFNFLINIFNDEIQPVIGLENYIGDYISCLKREVSIISKNNEQPTNIIKKLKIIERRDYQKFYLDLNNLYEELKPNLRQSIRNFGGNISLYEELIENKKIDFIFNLCSDFDTTLSYESTLKKKLLIWITQKLRVYYEGLDINRETSLEKQKDGETYDICQISTSPKDDAQNQHNQIITDTIKKLKDYIEKDPHLKFINCRVNNNGSCNCQVLIKRCSKIFTHNPQTQTRIAKELNVSVYSLNSLWKRKCFPLLYESALRIIDQQDLVNLLNEKEVLLKSIYFEDMKQLNAYLLADKLLINCDDMFKGINSCIKENDFVNDKQKARFRTFCKSDLLIQLNKIVFSQDLVLT